LTVASTPAIRAYQASDLETLVALWSTVGLVRPWNDPVSDIERKVVSDPTNLLVLEHGTSLIGSVMVGYEGHRGWINYLAVHPDRRREGLGRLLMDEAERRLRRQGCAKVNLQVRTSNRSAVQFYRRLGYTVDDVVSLGRRLEVDSAEEPSP
jgi:ribosomal protein S18 acetylase RimI-like enzyme